MTDYLKLLHDDMQSFAVKNGIAMYKVYTSLVDYMVGWLDITGKPVEGWQFNSDQNKLFHQMTKKVLQTVGSAIIVDGWRDPFGDIFMEYLGNKDLRGQCFTPENIANLCTRIIMDEALRKPERIDCGIFKNMIITNDPACGSGRMLLAAARYMELQHNEYIYCIGEDIDTTCVKQTAINLALHGCYGEVVCHDTLKNPDGLRFGYIVNEMLYPDRHNRPSLRFSDNPDDFVGIRFWNSQRGKPNKAKEPKKLVQLTLFDL